jgi:putative oxidoreductase
MKTLVSFLMLVGRIGIGLIFLISGVSKFFNYDANAHYMASKGMTVVPFFLIAAAVVEILGSLGLIFGYKIRLVATILFLYLIPVTLIFHDFWIVETAERQLQMILFLKNVGIMGGLLYVISCGAGGISLDHWFRRQNSISEEKMK